jgi:hypothetical protein
MHTMDHWISKHPFTDGDRAKLIDYSKVIPVAGSHVNRSSKHRPHRRLNAFRGWIGNAGQRVNLHHCIEAPRCKPTRLHLSALSDWVCKQFVGDAADVCFGDFSGK